MRSVGMCVGLACVMGVVGQASAAPVQWAGNGHFYEVISVPGSLSWEAASAAAVARGGTLATLTSQAENDFVFALADNATFWAGSSGPWLGGFQSPATADPAANWQWVTGEPWAYTNWQTAQPNDAQGLRAEDKLQFGFGPRVNDWNDILSVDPNPSFVPIAYVVEIVPEPAGLLSVALGAIACLRRRGAVNRGEKARRA